MAPKQQPEPPFRVAVVGGGITGAATACALTTLSRARERPLDVQLYEGAASEKCGAPALLSRECRSRLAALGCRVAPQWKAAELRGVEVISGTTRKIIAVDSADLWVVDAWGADG